jgi:hypothetical protein
MDPKDYTNTQLQDFITSYAEDIYRIQDRAVWHEPTKRRLGSLKKRLGLLMAERDRRFEGGK